MWNHPDDQFWAKHKAIRREPDHLRPMTEGPFLLDRSHPAADLCPMPRPTLEMIGGILAKLGITDPQSYLDMTPEERRRRQQERIDKWMRGEELD